jgi:hypothetical protein
MQDELMLDEEGSSDTNSDLDSKSGSSDDENLDLAEKETQVTHSEEKTAYSLARENTLDDIIKTFKESAGTNTNDENLKKQLILILSKLVQEKQNMSIQIDLWENEFKNNDKVILLYYNQNNIIQDFKKITSVIKEKNKIQLKFDDDTDIIVDFKKNIPIEAHELNQNFIMISSTNDSKEKTKTKIENKYYL